MTDDMKFLLWLLLLSSSSSCFGSEYDVQCLKTLKQSLGDPYGVLKSSWNFINGDNGYICQFTGVECRHRDENRVLSLHLGNLGLQGLFPRGLENCSSMTALDLSSNNLSGSVPSDISRQMPFLTSLDLSYNSFSGEIPASISNMTYLCSLSLQNNRFSGQIPDQINDLHWLTSINVAHNSLSGPIPSALQSCPASIFAGNQGLCGAPLAVCPNKGLPESVIAGTIGFVTAFPFVLVLSSSIHHLREAPY